MRKKLALLVALAISALFAGSAYSGVLRANQYADSSIPSMYTITGGTENTTTYDFSSGAGIDRWAYRNGVAPNPPTANNLPSTEFTSAMYTRISADDGVSQSEMAGMWYYASHRFVFRIYESNITSVGILWNGIGSHDIFTDGAGLYIWNCTNSSYELLDSNNSAAEIYLEGNISSGAGNYIGSNGNLTVLVVQNAPSFRFIWRFYSLLWTDYVKVDITYTGG